MFIIGSEIGMCRVQGLVLVQGGFYEISSAQ